MSNEIAGSTYEPVMTGLNLSQNWIMFLNRIARFRRQISVIGGVRRLVANRAEWDRMGYLGKNSVMLSNLASYPKLSLW